MLNYFLIYNLDTALQAARYSIAISLEKCAEEIHDLLHPTVTAKTHRAAYIEASSPHSIRIPLVMCNFHSTSSQEMLLRGEQYKKDAFLITTILNIPRL